MADKNYNPSSRPYRANKGEISTPADDGFKAPNFNRPAKSTNIDINHNYHPDLHSDAGTKRAIKTPANDGIVRSNFGKGKPFRG